MNTKRIVKNVLFLVIIVLVFFAWRAFGKWAVNLNAKTDSYTEKELAPLRNITGLTYLKYNYYRHFEAYSGIFVGQGKDPIVLLDTIMGSRGMLHKSYKTLFITDFCNLNQDSLKSFFYEYYGKNLRIEIKKSDKKISGYSITARTGKGA